MAVLIDCDMYFCRSKEKHGRIISRDKSAVQQEDHADMKQGKYGKMRVYRI